MSIVCIYHGNCFDGFTAAWVVRKHWERDVEFFPAVYGQPLPDVTDKIAVMVDFSATRPQIEEMIDKAFSFELLDHHKSALETLGDLVALNSTKARVHIEFDMNRSGAGMAWDHFFKGERRPDFIDRVEDRDLWRFKYADTRAVHSAMSSYPFEFDAWDRIADTSIEVLRCMGEDIDRKHLQDVKSLLPVVTRQLPLFGVTVPVANLPMTMTSDAGNMLCEIHKSPFAACYWDTPLGRVFSLRSLADGADVATLAQKYGGGGHAHAAGFTIPWGKEMPWQ